MSTRGRSGQAGSPGRRARPAPPRGHDAALKALREFGLAYPEAHTKSPWPTHLDLAVRDKTFAYLGIDGQPLSLSCKLPHSSHAALMLPFAKPTGYGLGKSGWVTAEFAPEEEPPLALLRAWIDESYRAQAPRRLVAGLAETAALPGDRRIAPRTVTGRKKKTASKRLKKK